ncbi:restriction endonuclease subunit S [Aromatoleum evansii]|uniref:restriction endonuclease subunit S n=1 Tax=Aromatoleum evansii TaxID=59406 RepID=UPI00145D6E88|nr:restriction endonuclease subunit S [Aromatoleum evansii]NMG32131.1 restriction endonuclease subunit S [Aromatoleum evansii]
MSEVHTELLGDLASARRGITYSESALRGNSEDGLPYVNMKSFLKNGGYNIEGLKYYAGFYTAADITRENDLLIANTDVTRDGDIIGAPAMLPNALGKSGVLFSHHVTKLSVSTKLSVEYLYYLLCSDEYRRAMKKYARGTTVLMLDMQGIKRIAVRYPTSKHEQKKVVSVLSSIDTAIEKTEVLIAKYQQIKAGLMHDLFTRGVLPNGQMRPPREQAPELYQETAIGWIPREWAVAKLGTMAKIVSGVTLGSKESPSDTIEAPYLRVANVQDGYLDLSEIKTVRISRKTLEYLRLLPGDVLMNEGGDFDKLGRGAVWTGEIDDCVHQNHVFRVRTDASVLLPNYLAFYSESTFGKKYFLLSSKQSTNLASINSTQLNAYPIALPSRSEQQELVARISRANLRIDAMKAESTKLRSQRLGLMQDLLTGKVSVKVDEPELVDG